MKILGCIEYHEGSICKQCESNYMLVNNLCCDPVCLSKIFSTNQEGLLKKTYSEKAHVLSVVLPFVQNGVLKGSNFKLEGVQSVQYQNVIRYFLLYHIINSYEGSYIAKRAIVDYNQKTKRPLLVDWVEVTSEKKYSKVKKRIIRQKKINSVLQDYTEIYPKPQDESFYEVFESILSEITEYRVFFYNKDEQTA